MIIAGVAVAFAVASALAWLPTEAGRFAGLAIFVSQIAVELRRNKPEFLVSPLFVLSSVALIGFSLVPALTMALLSSFISTDTETGRLVLFSSRPEIVAYFGSMAERYILSFAMCGCAAHGLVGLRVWRRSDRPGTGPRPAGARLCLGISVGLSIIFALGTQTGLLGASLSGFLNTAFGPVQAFLMVYLLHCAVVKRQIGIPSVVALYVLNIFLMILAHQGKIPVLIVVASALYFLSLRQLSLSIFLRISVLMILFVAAGIQIVQVVRLPNVSVAGKNTPIVSRAMEVAVSKLHWRQVESGYCFDNVLKRHSSEPFRLEKQTFWLEILVPRAMWPDKPDFSLGARYAAEYCKLPPVGPHSASITLLGQPVIQGGAIGLLLHGAILLLALGGLTLIARTRPGLPQVTVIALLPWWVDFDQDFALYVGNLVKFGLFMMPFCLLAWLTARNHSKKRTDSNGC